MDNVKQVVPLLAVADMERSLRFYVDGLAFVRKHQWVVENRIRWCWLTLGGASVMLQEILGGVRGDGGISLWFLCEDAIAIHHEVQARGIEASEPQVGNGMWVTTLDDPDGYRINFESPTVVAEETKLSELAT
jgi:lactoylglutathione lyase